MTMNDRYLTHKEKLEMFSAAEIMKALNDFFSDPNWRNKKRLVICSKYSTGVKCANMAADWAIDSAIRYLREEFGIFYAPDVVNKDDEYRKQDIKCTKDCYISYLEGRVEQLNKDVREKDKAARTQLKDDMDYVLNAFRDILDALGIDKSEYVHMDIPSLTRFAIMEAEKAGRNLDNYREGAVKFAADYSALQKEKEDLEKTVKASKENLMDILEALGVSKSCTIGQSMDFLQRHAVQRASLIKSERDKFLKIIDTSKAINDARYERLLDLANKIFTMYQKLFNPDPNETCACSAERQLEAIESYISELKITNEALRKDVSKLRIRCNSVFGPGGFVTKAMINDLCDEYTVVRPGDNEDCEESLRYIFDILKGCRDRCNKSEGEIVKLLKDMTKIANTRDALMKKYETSEHNRKEWLRRYESEHERANGEHKKADKYWAQVAGLQTRIKNLEDALNRSASNSTGYEALKNTLRKTLDSEVRLKIERDSLAEELKRAKDAIRKQNEAILRKERLDEPSDNCDSEE